MGMELLFLAVGMLFFLGLANSIGDVFEEGEHGLAYMTEKKMFLLANIHVTAKSNQIITSVDFSDNRDKVRVDVGVPIDTLDSGNKDRDKSVVDFLNGAENPNIRFITDWIDCEALAGAVSSSLTVPGELHVAGKSFKIDFPLSFSRRPDHVLIAGKLTTSFTNLEFEPPSVGMGGMIANVMNFLEIVVHLRSDKIEGLDEVLTSSAYVSDNTSS
ncbi:MAG: YceI family protein [Chlorobiales bacterium]|nr:YceI family protein [Chlorobiales bacterium]